MAVTNYTPKELANAARCLNCNLEPGQVWPVAIELLQELTGNTESPTELVDHARQIALKIPEGQRTAVIINLLLQATGL